MRFAHTLLPAATVSLSSHFSLFHHVLLASHASKRHTTITAEKRSFLFTLDAYTVALNVKRRCPTRNDRRHGV